MNLRGRIERLEARRGLPLDNQFRPDLVSYAERCLLEVFLCQAILADPHAAPGERADAEATLAARAPLPSIDEQHIASILERIQPRG
jgi:hypothetical protein